MLSETTTTTEDDDDKEAVCHRMVLVCGTSTCHMVVSQKKLFIPGVWGPFWSGTLPFNMHNKQEIISYFLISNIKSMPHKDLQH